MLYIGIDPGLAGGITLLNDNNNISSNVMPTISIGTKKEINVKSLSDYLKGNSYGCKMVGIEIQHAMPKQGVVSMFKIGKGYGILIGLLTALNFPFVEIRAAEWQKVMFAGQPKGNTKDLSKKISSQMYPNTSFMATSRCTTMHDGMTDSCMIATYIKQKYS